MTDFRALCQELMDAIDSGIPRGRIKQSPLAVRVDAALAQPAPQGPSDEDLDDLANEMLDWNCEGWRAYARAAIAADRARWGRLAIEPVPQQDDVHYAWELHDDEGEWQAGGSANSVDDVQREGNRYLQTYSQDGPHKLIIQQHRVTTIEPVPGVEGEP
jgi:hypothetical protein